MYPNLLSVVVINAMTQSHNLLLREARAGDQGRNLEQKLQRNKRNEAYCLVN